MPQQPKPLYRSVESLLNPTAAVAPHRLEIALLDGLVSTGVLGHRVLGVGKRVNPQVEPLGQLLLGLGHLRSSPRHGVVGCTGLVSGHPHDVEVSST